MQSGDICPRCHGTGKVRNYHYELDKRALGSGASEYITCPKCLVGGGRNPLADKNRPASSPPAYIWFFGLFGALMGGTSKPFGFSWPIEAFLGFIIGGFLAGLLAQFRIGRIILVIAGLGIVAIVAAGIYMAEKGG